MSTKTLRKRIALVAVSAMGFGLLSSVAANAAATAATLVSKANAAVNVAAVAHATASTSRGMITAAATIATDSTGTVLASGAVGLNITQSLAVDGATARIACAQVSGGTFSSTASADAVNTGATLACANNDFGVLASPTAAGTNMVIKLWDVVDANTATTGGTVIANVSYTVVSSNNSGTFSTADSFASIRSTEGGAEVTSNADTDGAYKVANGGQGIVQFTLHDVNDVKLDNTNQVSCSASGGAYCSFTSGTFGAASAWSAYSGTEFDYIYVAQGTANAAINTVVTISVNGAVWTTKSFTLVGDIAKVELAAGTNGLYGKVGTAQGQVGVSAYDSAGVRIAGKVPTFTSASYTTSVSSWAAVSTSATADDDVEFTCTTTKGSVDAQAQITNAAGTLIKSNVLKVSCVGAPYTYKASLDKTTYVPGDIAVLTVSASDSEGNPADSVTALGSVAKPVAISGSNMTAVTTPANTDTLSAGKKVYRFTVGSTEGSYNMVVDLPLFNAAGVQEAASVAYKIKASSSTVTNEQVLAAIVKLIASINKQILALQKALKK